MKMKMNPNIFFFFVVIFFFLLLLVSGAGHLDMNCQVSSCGDIANIRYPFWLRGKQPSYCGFPAFELQCEDGIPLIEMPSGEHQVKNIFYENNSLIVANAELAGSGCPVINSTPSFAVTPFAISPLGNRDLYFLYNCSHVGPDYFKVGCATTGNGIAHFVYLGGDYGSPEYVNHSCSAAAHMPVLGYPRANSSQYRTLLRNGFLLNYTVADCEQCTASKGQCGYNNETHNFICICSDRLHWKTCDAKNGKAIAIGASLGAAALIAVCCAVLCWCKRRKRLQQFSLSKLLSWNACSKFSSAEDTELGESNYHTHIFSYDELEEATNGFDVSRELGDGGFGTVYKGKLRDGRTVAVKRLYENNYRRLQQFMNEVDILSRLRHQNLVTLYGCTSRHSRELLLVYEYIPNGTVADHLHGTHAASAAGPLPWHSRISIAIETADALAYLHAVEPQIIHRDVKSNNILLDNNFHVKVADFGLSRLFPLDATHVSTAPQGTPGYLDPEYHQCYQLTDKSDVYSFGVVLVELISSKPAVDISRTRHEINLANMAVSKIQKRELDQLVDPLLGYDSDLEVKRMITQVSELAFTCLQSDGDLRPSIKEVLEILRGIESGSYKRPEEEEEEDQKKGYSEAEEAAAFSPDTVTQRWHSRSTTPSNSNSITISISG